MNTKRLDSLRIERFRQIRELTVPQIGHVNLIVGGNNSGKSTLLDALRLFAAKASPAILEELLGSHGELLVIPQQPELFVPERALCNLFSGRRFPVNDGEAIYVGDVDRRRFVQLEHVYLIEEEQERQVEGGVAKVRSVRKVSKEPVADLADAIEAVEVSTSQRSAHLTVLDASRVARVPLSELFNRRGIGLSRSSRSQMEALQSTELPCRYVASNVYTQLSLAEAWDEVVLTEGEGLALASLRMIEPQTSGLAFVQSSRWRSPFGRPYEGRPQSEERIAVLKLAASEAPVPLQSMGDGMLRVLQLVLAGLRARDGLLLVDEFENGLHYSVQSKIWQLLFELVQKNGLQIFATTHSNDCVRAFCEVALANKEVDGKLLKMERMPEDGKTVVAALGEEGLSNLLDAGIEVRG